MIITATTPQKVWFENFRIPKIGGINVHSEIYGNRFNSRKGRSLKLKTIESRFGTIVAQGEEWSEISDYHCVIFWTNDWVGVLDNNHGQESVYWAPRNPQITNATPRLPHPQFLIYDVWHLDPPELLPQGDFIARGICAKIDGEYGDILWTQDFVYATGETEYEGETSFFRGFPRNPVAPNP